MSDSIQIKSLWTTVNVAKDTGTPEIPNNMFLGDIPVSGNKIADCFADFFDEKVKNLVKNVGINELVENGTQS